MPRAFIIGAGPAGIVAALELAKHGFSVDLVEAGSMGLNQEINKMGEFINSHPTHHAPMEECMRRQVGGASNIWGGRIVPFDPIDFESNRFNQRFNWPIKYDELSRFFDLASNYCRSGRGVFNTNLMPEVKNKTIVDGMTETFLLSSDIERWSLPTNFRKEYYAEIKENKNIALHQNKVLIDACFANKKITSLIFKDPQGKRTEEKCDLVILCCGAIESTRFLLNLKRLHKNIDIDHGDCLGKFYMGHISGQIANIKFSAKTNAVHIGFFRDADGVYCRHRFTFAKDFLKQKHYLNLSFWPVNPKIGNPGHKNGVLSFVYLLLASPIGKLFAPEAIRKAATENSQRGTFAGHIKNVFSNLFKVIYFFMTFGFSRMFARRKIPGFFQVSSENTYPLHYHAEQSPYENSTINLAEEVDRLGVPKVKIQFCANPQDFEKIIEAHFDLDRELRRLKIGELQFYDGDLSQEIERQFYDGFHQAGTTKMGLEPSGGVTDKHGLVFGTDNLYVGSGSVFPTSGQANTTFMIIVFVLWMCEHLIQGNKVNGN